ncbi:hypothetical protein BGZ98_003747 [Dissophora globulifera]|nr:hypothetical protein BGZ98_003747 [Dissophora globulifera]
MAPSSAVLQCDFLVMDDAHNLDDKVDMSDRVQSSSLPMPPPPKRVRYSGTKEHEPTASDYAQIEPIIHPEANSTSDSPGARPTTTRSLSRSGPSSSSSSSSSSTTTTARSPMSRRRSIADMVPQSCHRRLVGTPMFVDGPGASYVCGEPVDSSSAAFPLEGTVEEPAPTPAITAVYPGSSSVPAGAASHNLKQAQEADTTMTMATDHPSSTTRHTNKTTPPLPPPLHHHHSSSSKSSSSLFISSPHPLPGHSRGCIGSGSYGYGSHSHNSTCGGSSGSHCNINSVKRGIQRPVRIQMLDSAESEMIIEQARRASVSDQVAEQLVEQARRMSSQSTKRNSMDDAMQEPFLDSTHHEADSDDVGDNDSDSDDVALPKEDPVIHDWDEEELEDEESGSETQSLTSGDAIPLPNPAFEKDKRRRSIKEDIRRAAAAAEGIESDFKPKNRMARARHGDAGTERNDEDDLLLDPEREVAAMTEDQEAELHNVHLRLENQREFQDVASLDLGEYDAQDVNEDGRYGGAIEADDEGEDYWENR